jgi:hypothetical protein
LERKTTVAEHSVVGTVGNTTGHGVSGDDVFTASGRKNCNDATDDIRLQFRFPFGMWVLGGCGVATLTQFLL